MSRAQVFVAPDPLPAELPRAVFLAGSIEQGVADDWQSRVCARLDDLPVAVLNPRREAWDSTWEQSISNRQFREQVEWELAAMDRADIIAMYFSPGTRAPITLLEMGLHAHTGKLRVCCPEGFWRKGNVDVTAARYAIEQFESLDALVDELRRELVW